MGLQFFEEKTRKKPRVEGMCRKTSRGSCVCELESILGITFSYGVRTGKPKTLRQ